MAISVNGQHGWAEVRQARGPEEGREGRRRDPRAQADGRTVPVGAVAGACADANSTASTAASSARVGAPRVTAIRGVPAVVWEVPAVVWEVKVSPMAIV